MPFHYPGKPSGSVTGIMWQKMVEAVVIPPLAHLLAWILGGSPEDWNTIEEIQTNLIPALIRLPIRIIVSISTSASSR